jgi:hypothetical protein
MWNSNERKAYLGVFRVCDSITDDTFEESLENTTSLFVDHGWNTLDTTTASETSDSWLGYALDVVSQDLAMSLGPTLAEALATLAASSHVDEGLWVWRSRRARSGMVLDEDVDEDGWSSGRWC